MRVASMNLLHGRSPGDGVVDPDRLRSAVRLLDADVLCLQEVDRGQERSGGLDLTEICAAAADAVAWRFEPALTGPMGAQRAAVGGESGPAYGVGIVSRFPVTSWHLRRLDPPWLPIPMPGLLPVTRRGRVRLAAPRLTRDESRVVLAAVLSTPDGPITIGCAHLTFVQGSNIGQLRTALGLLRPLPGPRLLLGDLNMAGRLPARVSGWQPLVSGRTFPTWRPRFQIDHILADREPEFGAGRVVAVPVSDHRAVVADVEFSAAGRRAPLS